MKYLLLAVTTAITLSPATSLPEPSIPGGGSYSPGTTYPTDKYPPMHHHGSQYAPPQPVDTKYFHEPGAGEVYGHYDVRYYAGTPVNDTEKKDSLRHLARSYLATFRANNIETWLAHGTLLGWWWNGKIMPWDWDLDTQVSETTLLWLGENMNMTTHNYTFTTDRGVNETRQYLLDVNPNAVERLRGDGQNVIDARWIDVRNGLFIDITGLSETQPNYSPGVWSCKNYHRYRTREIYPLRETVFEGTPALVPYSFDSILVQEYSPRALTKTEHEGHRWNPEQKVWEEIDYSDFLQGREVPRSTDVQRSRDSRRAAARSQRSVDQELQQQGPRNAPRAPEFEVPREESPRS